MDDFEYDTNKRSDKTYISKSLPAFHDKAVKVRIASKAFDKSAEPAFALVKGELVLRQKEGGKHIVKATFFEDDRKISVLNLQTYTAETGSPHKASFALIGNEIGRFIEFAKHIQEIAFHHDGAVNITDDELRKYIVSERQATALLIDNPEVLAEVLRTKITKEDIVAIGYLRAPRLERRYAGCRQGLEHERRCEMEQSPVHLSDCNRHSTLHTCAQEQLGGHAVQCLRDTYYIYNANISLASLNLSHMASVDSRPMC